MTVGFLPTVTKERNLDNHVREKCYIFLKISDDPFLRVNTS